MLVIGAMTFSVQRTMVTPSGVWWPPGPLLKVLRELWGIRVGPPGLAHVKCVRATAGVTSQHPKQSVFYYCFWTTPSGGQGLLLALLVEYWW